jgi:hypothetical protein
LELDKWRRPRCTKNLFAITSIKHHAAVPLRDSVGSTAARLAVHLGHAIGRTAPGQGSPTPEPVLRWTPHPASAVVRRGHEHVWVDWVPRNAVDCPRVPGQHGDRLLLLHVVDVNLAVLAAAGDKVLLLQSVAVVAAPAASEAAVDGEVTLRDADVLAHETARLDVPQVQALVVDVEEGVAVGRVDGEGNDAVVFLKNL